jgi:hypothetical protein
MVSSGYIRLEEACFMEDFSIDDHSCHLVADAVCGYLP